MKKVGFEFDKDTHTYWLDGKEMPSLTRILSPIESYQDIPEHVLSNKRKLGCNIHETIKLYLSCSLDMDSLAEGNQIALDLFIEWFHNKPNYFGHLKEFETPTYHPKLLYGCTPDLVFDEAIVEIKTRPYKNYRDDVQLIAQAKCFHEFPHKDLYVLHIDIFKRKLTLQKSVSKQAWSIFRKLIDKTKKDMEIELLVEKWKEYSKGLNTV